MLEQIQQLRRSLVELNSQLEASRDESARMRGVQEQLLRDMAEVQRKQRDGAPITAVMSYATWKEDAGGDPSIIGSTFWMNTKPVTIIGVAPRGFYGDRISPQPPKY